MAKLQKSSSPGITIRFPKHVRERVTEVATFERRSAAAYIEGLVERDLRQRDEEDRAIHVYVSEGAPEWKGTLDRDEGETDEAHAERTEVVRKLFGWEA